MQLLCGYVIAVHEEVQQIHSQMSRSRTESEPVAHNGNQVCKVSSQV